MRFKIGDQTSPITMPYPAARRPDGQPVPIFLELGPYQSGALARVGSTLPTPVYV